MFEFGSIFDDMFSMQGISGFMPVAIPMLSANTMFPVAGRVHAGKSPQGRANDCGCSGSGVREAHVEIDEEMKMRRELNAQLRAAIDSEEYEKAAELRDKIRALESASAKPTCGTQDTGGTKQCDSEIISQDSQAAQ